LKKLETLKSFFSHTSLREIAHTLNCFNIIEIAVIAWFTYEIHLMLTWYKTIMTVEHFNGVAYWGAVAGIITVIIGAFKFINDTLKEHRKS